MGRTSIAIGEPPPQCAPHSRSLIFAGETQSTNRKHDAHDGDGGECVVERDGVSKMTYDRRAEKKTEITNGSHRGDGQGRVHASGMPSQAIANGHSGRDAKTNEEETNGSRNDRRH